MTSSTTRRIQKNLTVMFTDISGFTQHTEMISREALMKRLETHNELLMPIVAHFEGKIVKTIGDAFLITFESPTNAVQCGLFMQHTLAKFNKDKPVGEQIHIKVSINSGEVTVTDTDVFGDPVNVAAKIEKATNPDEIYFTEAVFLAMNKAEVPTSFVKSFRPKGADSQEIKLYKVAMDEGDERYQKVIQGTKIDPERVKTRVAELSSLAEKEFSRYQDTLEALVESQGKSSRNMIVTVLVAVVILAVVIVVAVSQFSGKSAAIDPAEQLTRDVRVYLASGKAAEARQAIDAYMKERGTDKTTESLLVEVQTLEKTQAESAAHKSAEQLARDVRQYLANNKPAEARQAVDAYMKSRGADKTTGELLDEIRSLEINDLAAQARNLIADGKPENAAAAVNKYFGAKPAEGDARKALEEAQAYLAARDLLDQGKAADMLAQIKAAFGDRNPSAELKQMRERADALIRARDMMATMDRFREPARIIGTISRAFGDDVSNPAALDILEEALANEVFRITQENGYDKGAEEREALRKRFSNVRSWKYVTVCLCMGYVWKLTMDERSGRRRHDDRYWFERNKIILEYANEHPELMYRFGTMLFILDRKRWQSVASGVDCWRAALKADPKLADRHAEFWKIYEIPLHEDHAVCAKDLKSALVYSLGFAYGPVGDVRALIKERYYREVRDTLVAFANNKDNDNSVTSERANSFAILAEMGDASLIVDRFWLFRQTFDDYMTGDTPGREHMAALFAEAMTAEDYKEYRAILDTNLRDVRNKEGRYSGYTRAQDKLVNLLEDLRRAQPAHTDAFGG